MHENRSTRWIPPAVAVRIGKFRPLQEPIRLQDLLNSARSRAEKKIKAFIGIIAAMLRDSVVIVRTHPRAIPLAMITMRKSTHRFPFASHMGMGLRY